MGNKSTNINNINNTNNYLAPQTQKGIPAYCVGYTDPGLGQAENCGEVKLFN